MRLFLRCGGMIVTTFLLALVPPCKHLIVTYREFYCLASALQVEVTQSREKIVEFALDRREIEEQLGRVSRQNAELIKENRAIKKELLTGKVLFHGDRSSSKVAITIDDGGCGLLGRKALDYLKEAGARATFFPAGFAVDADPVLWRRVVEEGHELGNHTYNHYYLTDLSEKKILAELRAWQDSVERVLGEPYPTLFFRPPGMVGFSRGGAESAYYSSFLGRQGMITALWDIETVYALYSSRGPRKIGGEITPERVAEYIVEQAQGGSIILLHFVHMDIEALPFIIDGFHARGLEPVTLSDMIFGRDPARDSGG